MNFGAESFRDESLLIHSTLGWREGMICRDCDFWTVVAETIYWDYLFHKLVKKGMICPFYNYKSTKMKRNVQKKMSLKKGHVSLF
jgi:hypothetical protein